MAPWPDRGNEPKAPDKSEVAVLSKASLEDSPDSNKSEQQSAEREDKEILTLDDGQLKALLDEAITYKNPKDREGKSELFKNLLQAAEEDESNTGLGNLTGKLPKNNNLPGKRRHSRHQGRECGVGVSTTRGGSLQNLHALGMEGGSRGTRSRKSGRSGETLVSARQREGGSLPANVNVEDNDPELDSLIGHLNYTSRATLEVSGSGQEEPLNKPMHKPTSVDDSLALFQGHSFANGNERGPLQLGPSYTTVKSLLGLNQEETFNYKKDEQNIDSGPKYASSICVGPVESGAMLYSPSPIQHVSVLSIPPSQLPVNSEEKQNTENSENKNVKWDRRYRHVMVASETDYVNPLATAPSIVQPPDNTLDLQTLRAHFNRYSSFTLLDFRDPRALMDPRALSSLGTSTKEAGDNKKSLDENGNALNGVRADSNCVERKKQRRVKTKNDQNFILSEDIEGFRGAADIETLMKYIESPTIDSAKSNKTKTSQPNGPRNHVKVRAKEEEARPIRRRGKDKLQRCNSLEEISKTKLEDLTEESSTERVNGSSHNLRKKQGTLDDAQVGKKSWSNESRLQESSGTSKKAKDRGSPDVTQDAEFHVVTKRHRKKKRRSGCSGRMINKPQYYAARGFPAHDRDGSSSLLYQYRHGRSNQSGSQPRRKSASSVPPSDKSDSSDLDSVHSLPVTSSSRTKIGKNSVSGDSTPRAPSYADIARTMASPPDIDIQGICSPPLPDLVMLPSDPIPNIMLPTSLASTVVKKDAMTDTTCDTIKSPLPNEEYPPLEIKTADLLENLVKCTHSVPRDNDNSEDKVSLKTVIVISGNVPHSKPKSNVTRPPVILMNEPMVNSNLPTELTFGFEVNQQLLQCEEPECSVNTLTPPPVASSPAPAPPTPPQFQLPLWDTNVRDPNVKRMLEFLNKGLEDVMEKLQSGKAEYYQDKGQ